MLTAWKRNPETAWLTEPSKGPLQAALRNLQAAYDRFWRKQAGYPKFKKKSRSKDSASYFSNCFTYRHGEIKLAKHAEPLDIRWSRPLPEGPYLRRSRCRGTGQVVYHISILVETVIVGHPVAEATLGIDAGITSLYTFSNGEKVANPRYEQKDRDRLARAQRAFAKKQKGSANQHKMRLRVARIHARIADRRSDHLHKLSTRLVREKQVLAIEDLSVRNMLRNRALARAISDASWAQFRSMLEYKAPWYGRTVVAIDRFYPSTKTCSTCGRINDSMSQQVREWQCVCGAWHDRDVNAAKTYGPLGWRSWPAEMV